MAGTDKVPFENALLTQRLSTPPKLQEFGVIEKADGKPKLAAKAYDNNGNLKGAWASVRIA
jgi:hypothetical protein